MIGLTFLFGFGNVLALGLRLGVPAYVAPLVAPAVDLSVLGLLLGVRYLALNGAPREHMRPARRLLVLASVMTLALNVTEPLLAGHYGRAAFDAVGPLLLIGWAEVGPGLLQAISSTGSASETSDEEVGSREEPGMVRRTGRGNEPVGASHRRGGSHREVVPVPDRRPVPTSRRRSTRKQASPVDQELLRRARSEDAHHRREHQRPISAETLRKRLHVGARTSRALVAAIRSEAGAAEPASDANRALGACPAETDTRKRELVELPAGRER
ncbi:SpdA protein [Streptomyces sp. NPDC127098]|uniref:SpdA protein n=1 Tax=Streptomyces sp. NPDC127098 TaxID=3347137 RepID=UPI00365706BD